MGTTARWFAGSWSFSRPAGDLSNFEHLKFSDKARELTERIKTLCRVLSFPFPHDKIPDTWRRLTSFAEVARHFFVHPYPDPTYFQSHMKQIMTATEAGEYVKVAEEILAFLYRSSGKTPPSWVTCNTLLRFKGMELLVDDESPSNPRFEGTPNGVPQA
jgi:hypothetical protein